MHRETSAAPSKQHDSHCTTANRLCQGGRMIFVWFDLCPVSHTTEAPSPLVLKAPFVRKRRNASPLLSLWLSKHGLPIRPVSHLAGAPSPLVLKAPFVRKRRKASHFFHYGRQSIACPCVQSRTWQERPQPRLSARFKRKRRNASPRPPQKNAKPLSDLRLSQRKISAGRAAFNRAF